jgi:hypothetical protein
VSYWQQDRGRPVAEEGGRIGVVHNGGQEEEANCSGLCYVLFLL